MKKTISLVLSLLLFVGLFVTPLSVSAALSAMIDSVTGSATGVAYDGTNGAYALTSPNFVVKSGDRTLNYSTLIMNEPMLFSNKACTSAYKLTTTPIPGTTYYTYVLVDLWEKDAYDLTYDYDYIEDNFSFTLPGYDVAFYSLAEREMGSYLDITFTLTPKRSEIADVDLVADGLVFDEESDSYVPNITSTSIKDADGKAITNLDPVWHSGMYTSGSFVAANKTDDDPEPGVTYYASVYVDLYKHGVYDYDYVGYYAIADNFSLTIPGYKVEFYDFMEREMGSYMDIKYKITRDVVEIGSVTGTATGVAHDGTLGAYALTNPVTSVKDINGKAITDLDEMRTVSLYTSNMYSNETKLTTEPQVGVTYYSSILVDLYKMNTYWLGYDYGDIEDNFSLTVPGYDVKFHALSEREMGSYIEVKFTLVRKSIDTVATLSKTSYSYNGKVQKPTVTVKDAQGNVVDPSYYTVSYSGGCKTVGTYKVTVTFKDDYSEAKTLSYKITPQDVSKCTVTLSKTSYSYNGKVQKPTVTVKSAAGTKLTEGGSYTVTYASGCKVAGTYKVTIKMKGNYTGTVTKTFKIAPQDVSKCTVTLSKTSYAYDGKVKKPTVTVKNASGTKLTEGGSYTVTYASGRKNAGTYKVTVKMKGNYTGTVTKTFKIAPQDVSKCKITLSATSYTYNGSVKKPTVTVKNAAGTKLTEGGSYTVTYATGRKNVGSYKVTIKMKGNYTGTKTLTFKINPAKTSISSLTAGSKKLTVKWAKKTTQVTGYEIQYSTSKSFSSGVKTKTITKNSTVSAALTGLKAKTTYYVRVRTYKTVNGVKYYSGWTTVKSAKTK